MLVLLLELYNHVKPTVRVSPERFASIHLLIHPTDYGKQPRAHGTLSLHRVHHRTAPAPDLPVSKTNFHSLRGKKGVARSSSKTTCGLRGVTVQVAAMGRREQM